MKNSNLVLSAAYAMGQILVVLFGLLIGIWLGTNFTIIPKSILAIHPSAFTATDGWAVARFFLFVGTPVFFISHMLFGHDVLTRSRRFAIAVYALILTMTLASVSLFFLSTVNFSPDIFAATALSSLAMFCLIFIGSAVIRSDQGVGAAWPALKSIVADGFGLLTKWKPFPVAALITVLAITPVALGKLYKSDRAFAAAVTEIRIALNTGGAMDYEPVSAYPGLYFRQPMMVRFSQTEPHMAYVLERHGKLFSFDTRNALDTKTLLLDFSEKVNFVEIELGALGFDLHPDFDSTGQSGNQLIFVNYTHFIENERQHNRLVRFDLAPSTPEARAETELQLWQIEREPNGYHNAGSVDFGPDGFLYTTMGDALDHDGYQRLDYSFMGSVLRLDVDQQGGDVSHPPVRQPSNGTSANYFIPKDNPFVGREDTLEEIYALGLRNPFRISFDRETGKMWAGDVGNAKWEEVNVIVPGGNYEFPHREGEEQMHDTLPDPMIGTPLLPYYTYIHTAYERSIIGGFVYRGTQLPTLDGHYVFADNYSGHVFKIAIDADRVTESKIVSQVDQFAQRGISSLVPSPSGELLLTTLGDINNEAGEILKLLPPLEAERHNREQGVSAPVLAAVDPSDISGADLYGSYCARCHGDNADGQIAEMTDLGFVMPDFTSAEYHARRDSEFLHTIIWDGGGQLGVSDFMPPWDMIMTEEEVDAVVDYLQQLPEDAS